MAERLSIIAANSLLLGLQSALALSKIHIYSGSQPTTPLLAASGTLLATITVDGDGTGLTWDTPANGIMSKVSADSWSATVLATGTAGWCRVSSATDTSPGDPSTTHVRVDMQCTRTGSTECVLSTLSLVAGGTVSVDSADIEMPVA